MERSKSLSIRSVKRYKLFLIAMVTLFFGFYVIYYTKMSGLFGILMAIIYVGLMVFYWYPNIGKFLRKIKEVSYDNENLYVREGDYEIQIPFYQVKDIEIISMDGLYKFKLYHHDQFGSEVVCKPSIWYPFNYKRIDAELNRIRSYVRKAHREYKEQIVLYRSLTSN
ncbi:hypothetical protein [Ekhidna sp.]|jgi:hypothetical protein|uniref:hypothetical protein n=1 Tax=Ekhidna sp. TaxID=2608089 RepID=UPI0032EF73A3